MKCPVCEKELKCTYRDVLDGWCLMESEWQCPDGHYSMYYATGMYIVTVNGVEYDEDQESIDRAVEEARRDILKN